jgi:hypothetical protein
MFTESDLDLLLDVFLTYILSTEQKHISNVTASNCVTL